MNVDKEVNEIANSETGKKLGLNSTIVYIILGMIVLVIASKIFGF